VDVTEDGRICRPGDVVNITDDIANLALCAGEVIYVAGLVLTLDHEVDFAAGANTILLRDLGGVATDAIPITAGATPNKVVLSREPSGVSIKPRDEALGTLYAVYASGDAKVRHWLLTGVEISGPYVKISGVNYTDTVYAGDSATMEPRPVLP